MELFKKSFTKLLDEKKIVKLPNFLTEEYVLDKCGILSKIENGKDRIKSGWFVQQMVKMCIHKTKIAKDYMTFDSDAYLVKDITNDLFYQNNILKTVGLKLGDDSSSGGIKYFSFDNTGGESDHKFETHSYIRYIFNAKNKSKVDYTWYQFVKEGYMLWSSEILIELTEYVKNKMNFDIADLINISPWEMQWYGQFIASTKADNLYLMPDLFVTKLGYRNEQLKYWFCTPTNGYKESYLMVNQVVDANTLYVMPDTKWCKVKDFFRKFI